VRVPGPALVPSRRAGGSAALPASPAACRAPCTASSLKDGEEHPALEPPPALGLKPPGHGEGAQPVPGGSLAAHLALAAHLVPLVEALLLRGAQRVPGGDQVTERDVHLAVAL